MDKNAYPVFPNADSGADPSVPAEQGGTGEGGLSGLATAERTRLGQAEPLGDEAPRRQGRELLITV